MPVEHKALVISVRPQSVPQGQTSQWNDMTSQMEAFTGDIITPEMNEGADMSAVVSGVPTVFARANLFNLSIDYVQRQQGSSDNATSLIKFYEGLADEWRGFIACIALDYKNITVRRIDLCYSDGGDISTTANIYEPKGAFGNMLFKSRDLWCDQNVADNEKKVPFINVIKYKGMVVGATSPSSLLFTAPEYRITEDEPFVNFKTRRFTDPLHSTLSQEEACALQAYVGHILGKIDKLRESYAEEVRPDYSSILADLQQWKEEIDRYIANKGFKDLNSSVPPVDCFKRPFSILFNYSSKLYGLGGIIYGSEQEDAVAFDPKKLLLPRGTEIVRLIFSDPNVSRDPSLLQDIPFSVLKAVKKGSNNAFAYFALPFSEDGLNVFGDSIDAMTGLNTAAAVKSTLSAVFDPEQDIDNLEVKLDIVTDEGRRVPISVTYNTSKIPLQYKDIMIWPNFISRQWSRYFLYSEMPHNISTNDCPFRATPFLGRNDASNFKILTDDDNRPVFIADGGHVSIPQAETTKDVTVELHVMTDHTVNDNLYKYEIYESNLPFKGVRLTASNNVCGFFVIRYSSGKKATLPYKDDLLHSLREAEVGIDFGSTNTSVAYFTNPSDMREPAGIEFRNQTVSLFGQKLNQPNKVAMEKDMFFFQNEEISSNGIKSVLTLHDQRRMVRTAQQMQNEIMSKEVKGGFPCFEKNLPIDNVSDRSIKLHMREVGDITLVHNMKWNKNDDDKANKQAFLRSLLLHVYAELFVKDIVPVKVKWSYPSSMGRDLLNQYQLIWDSLATVCPVKGNDGNTVTLHVSRKPGVVIRAKEENVFSKFNNDAPFGSNPFGGADGNPFNVSSGSPFGCLSDTGDPFSGSVNENEKATTVFGSSPFDGGAFSGEDSVFGGNTQPAVAVVDLKPDEGPIKFNFRPVNQDESMTEACAVANYVMRQNAGPAAVDILTLCFDVGGSTTDISALCKMKDGNGMPQTAMIKQNSIRFAAQRVSEATRHSANLRTVLLKMCAKYNLHVAGLNMGDNKYSPDTASYYFNLIVDMLDSEKLVQLYKEISANCQELMTVNLYVTGLIMYYAGQLTRKIVSEVRRSDDGLDPDWHPLVNVVFAGKGSRIFEWLSSTDERAANSYYGQMFIRGIGGMGQISKYLCNYAQIKIMPKDDAAIKYEVSKGLVYGNDQTLLVPDENKAIEILGEEGYKLKTADGKFLDLPFDNSITPKMLEHIGTYLLAPTPMLGHGETCKKFMDFAGLFFNAARSLFNPNMKIDNFMRGFNAMNMSQYIVNLPDFRNARMLRKENRGSNFDYVAPIIILEGMKFYDEFLMDCIQ